MRAAAARPGERSPQAVAGRRVSVLALAALAAGWALSLWVFPWSDERVNDLFVYRTFAEPVVAGGVPYRDVGFEYPPLAAPAIALPGLLGTGEETFRWAYAAWTLLAAAAVVLLCGALARATGGDPRRAMLAAASMPLLCGALLRTHFDLFPVALFLLGLLLVCRDRPPAGLAVLGLGALTKAFPLVAVPVVLASIRSRGAVLRAAAACAAVVAVGAGAAVLASPDGALDAVRYHAERPVQVESSPALVLLGLDAAGLGDVVSVKSHRSDGLLHPASGWITALGLVALAALVALLCAAVAREHEGAQDDAARRRVVLASFAAVIGFVLFGKVLSPQFVVWVLPLGALALAWGRHVLAAAVAAAALLTHLEFPSRYFDVVAREPSALALVAGRNAVLAGVLLLAVRELRGLQPRGQQQLLDARRAALAVRLD